MWALEVGVMKLQLDFQELPLHKYEEVLSTSFYSTALDSSRGSLSDFRTSMNPPKWMQSACRCACMLSGGRWKISLHSLCRQWLQVSWCCCQKLDTAYESGRWTQVTRGKRWAWNYRKWERVRVTSHDHVSLPSPNLLTQLQSSLTEIDRVSLPLPTHGHVPNCRREEKKLQLTHWADGQPAHMEITLPLGLFWLAGYMKIPP
jgi:hypothetical protein